MSSRSVVRLSCALLLVVVADSSFAASTPPMQIEHDVTVLSMSSDRFTWFDSALQQRIAVLAHNNGPAGPGGTLGGELRQFVYQTAGGARTVNASGSSASGFGYIVAHPHDSEACIAAVDTSPFGHFFAGTFTRVFEGPHHAIFRFQQNYPRFCQTGANPPAQQINIPVTIEWVFSTGRDNPLWAVTYDLSGIAANTLLDDSRAPYGEMLFDGASTEQTHSVIAGVGWGDGNKFLTTSSPVTFNSSWDWSAANTIPYVKLWTTAIDATMGVVMTQTIQQQDAGGYFDATRWGSTSAAGNACAAQYTMPCDYNWDYQTINYSLAGPNATTNNTRLAWGTEFGFLGQSSYAANGSQDWGGPLGAKTAPGHPRKSYSTYVVLGSHTPDKVDAQVTQVEVAQTLSLTASVGSVVTGGPAGVNRDPVTDSVTYSPAGYNHVYGALAFAASNNRLDANIGVGAGTLINPLIIVSNYTRQTYPQSVTFGGTALTADSDYYASLRTSASELWLTLKRNVTGPTNRLVISPTIAAGDFNGDGKVDLVLRNYTTGQNALWLMNGTTLSSIVDLPALPNTNYRIEGTGDFNGDGKPDLVLRNYSTGQNAVWLMNGTTLMSIVDLPALPNTAYHIEGTGDFNGDGKPDIILRNYSTGQNAVWLMNGTTLSSVTDLPALPNTNYRFESCGDFNSDGQNDIVLRNYATGQNALWLMNGTTLTSIVDLPALPNTAYRIDAVGDFNGDSKPDLVLRNYNTGQNAVWIMNGTSLSSIVDLPALPNTAYEINGPR